MDVLMRLLAWVLILMFLTVVCQPLALVYVIVTILCNIGRKEIKS